MKIAVTGAAGFIGSHLVERLLADGHSVVGIDNLLTGRRENLGALPRGSDFELVERDCSEPLPDAAFRGTLGGVFHLASPASPVDYVEHPLETLRVGSEGTRNALELARAKGARFLLASTSEVYGDPEVHPQREDYWGNVNPTGPRSVYDEAKRFAEALASAYAREGLVSVRIARIFNTYGPRMRPRDGRVVSSFVCAALRGEPLEVYGDGSQTRSFCFVSDMAEGLVRLFESEAEGPVNLGNPEETTIAELAREVIELARSSSKIERRPLPEDDPRRRRPDITLARELLGWRPVVTRREGLSRTIEHFARELAPG
jgi:dTDP-glucose 4,6-dehydratase